MRASYRRDIDNPERYPFLFLDLDGTVRDSASGGFISSPADIVIKDHVREVLREHRDTGWVICGITNQGGVAHGFKTEKEAKAENDRTRELLPGIFYAIEFCPFHEDGTVPEYSVRSLRRKPEIGMIACIEKSAHRDGLIVDYERSLLIGDRSEDLKCAWKAGIAFQWAHEFFRWETVTVGGKGDLS